MSDIKYQYTVEKWENGDFGIVREDHKDVRVKGPDLNKAVEKLDQIIVMINKSDKK